MTLRRRDLTALLGLAPVLPLAAGPGSAEVFGHGVASGDPGARDVLLWTRVTPPDGGRDPVLVQWSVWREGDAQARASGFTEARAERDFTVKVVATDLEPGLEYLYAFTVADRISPVGRTRTLPVGPTADLALVVASCQSHAGGLFNAWDAMARLDRVDAVVHLGDYIYEYGPGPDTYGRRTGSGVGRAPAPPRELTTLADYRTRHAQYKADPDLQAAHARAAFICVFDDHELANDAWTGGAQNHSPETEGAYAARKAAALRAYFEWMPIREPVGPLTAEALNRAFQFGDLATLAMLETRLTARDRPLTYDDLHLAEGGADVAAFEALRHDPARELIGDAQRAWLGRTLGVSRAGGTRWQLIGNQVVMARVRGPDVDALANPVAAGLLTAMLPAALRRRVRRMIDIYRLGMPWNLDTWDGFPAARERLYALFARLGVQPLVLSGDSHAWWVNDLCDQAGERRAVEFGVTAISSPSAGDAAPRLPLGQALASANPEVAYCHQTAKGFLRLILTPDRAVAELHRVSTVRTKPYRASILKRFTIRRTDCGLGEIEES